MGILGKVFGQQGEKHSDIRKALFGDVPPELWPPDSSSDTFPWSAFKIARTKLAAGDTAGAAACWREILDQGGLEPRHYLQAWHFLRQFAQQRPRVEQSNDLLGVVIEVGLPQGVDLLAAYADHSALYYNYSGAGVVWEHPDASLDPAIDHLLEASHQVIAQLGVSEQPRPDPPPLGHARVSALTPGGIHCAEGSMAELARDPGAGQVLQSGAALMRELIAKSTAR